MNFQDQPVEDATIFWFRACAVPLAGKRDEDVAAREKKTFPLHFIVLAASMKIADFQHAGVPMGREGGVRPLVNVAPQNPGTWQPQQRKINDLSFVRTTKVQRRHVLFCIIVHIGKSISNIHGIMSSMQTDRRFLEKFNELAERFESDQQNNLYQTAGWMADAIAEDRLIYLFGGGGHTCLVMQELFWRAGGLANLCPMIDFAIHPVTPAYMYLGHERMHGVGNALVDYYGIASGDLLLCFHSYGFNPPTIDCALRAKEKGARVVGISSSDWGRKTPKDFPIRHKSGKHLFDVADICLENYVPFGDTVIQVEGFSQPISGISSTIDFYIAHRLEIECVKECVARGIEPPVWCSANIAGGDERNAALRARYNPRVKFL